MGFLEGFKEKFQQHNWKSKEKKLVFGLRAFVLTGVFISGIANSLTGWAVQQIEVDCIEDQIHIFTQGLNDFISDSDNLALYLCTLSSLVTDGLFLCFCIRYLFWGLKSNPLIFLFLFYPLAGLINLIFTMNSPDDLNWAEPAIPSFLIPNQLSPTFYYSTVSGVLLFFVLENRDFNNRVLMWFSVLALVVISFLIITLRRDYTVSVISGVFMAHYFWIISNQLGPKVDEILFSHADKNLKT